MTAAAPSPVIREAPPSEDFERLEAFRAAVDALLPGRYSWMQHASLHCTLRSLDAPSLADLGYAYVAGESGGKAEAAA